MGGIQRPDSGRKYIPYLDGIRGYGFLLVFFAHYFPPGQLAHEGGLTFRVLNSLGPIEFLAVPTFFILSGYLIGGILYGTREREGFFRVFYARRVVRVFPVYYLTLVIIACVETYQNFPLNYHFWTHFLFIQNLFRSYTDQHSPAVLIHYWSLATEEQFYLFWPLVVWFFRSRKRLLAVATALIVLTFCMRLAAPLFYQSAEQIRYLSLTRADAILMGVVMALAGNNFTERLRPYAKWIALSGTAVAVLWAFLKGEAWPETFRGVNFAIPWLNFAALAIVVGVMEEGSWLNRVCSQRWVCWLGRRSYSLYIVHFTYARFFWHTVIPQFSEHLPRILAVIASNLIAFCVTLILATLSYYLIEKPGQKLKQRLKYGDVKKGRSARRSSEELPLRAGA